MRSIGAPLGDASFSKAHARVLCFGGSAFWFARQRTTSARATHALCDHAFAPGSTKNTRRVPEKYLSPTRSPKNTRRVPKNICSLQSRQTRSSGARIRCVAALHSCLQSRQTRSSGARIRSAIAHHSCLQSRKTRSSGARIRCVAALRSCLRAAACDHLERESGFSPRSVPA